MTPKINDHKYLPGEKQFEKWFSSKDWFFKSDKKKLNVSFMHETLKLFSHCVVQIAWT